MILIKRVGIAAALLALGGRARFRAEGGDYLDSSRGNLDEPRVLGDEFQTVAEGSLDMRMRVLGLTLSACCFLTVRASARDLSVGDPAPPLQVSRWIKGETVERFEPGKVYVLDFWATWCGPCIESFPQLTRLQKKYAGKGVTVIGVSVWEEDQGAVEPFVKARSDAMGYSVALDVVPMDKAEKGKQGGSDGKMAEAWMRAAGKNLIPTVFIVGRDGKIAWIGGPKDMDEPLERIVAGKWYSGAPDKEFIVFPAPAPVPALGWALLPRDPDRTPGDAAPIYLRLRAEGGDAGLREAASKANEWLRRPLRDFPAVEAGAFLERWSDQLKEIEYGARRRSCDWNYPIRERSEQLIMIQFTDAYRMARWSALLALKARVEIAGGRCGDALHTIASGLAFHQHAAGAPFLLHTLVATGGDQMMFDRLDELITLPDAPNLYWALTALPRPLVDFRSAMENESRLIERLVPELTDTRRSRSEADWSALLSSIIARMDGIEKMYGTTDSGKGSEKAVSRDLARLKAELLPEARSYVAKMPKADRAANVPMSDNQVIVLYIAGWYRERWDDLFKASYLPYPEARPFYDAAIAQRRREETSHPLALLSGLAPAVPRLHEHDAEVDRRVAALRAVEAVRLHAAANGGRMPASIDAVGIVPIPPDPVTGKPFLYAREGETATLVREGPPPARLKVVYRIAPRG
jgi:thiol-disulfide isomerase/thioredoxin